MTENNLTKQLLQFDSCINQQQQFPTKNTTIVIRDNFCNDPPTHAPPRLRPASVAGLISILSSLVKAVSRCDFIISLSASRTSSDVTWQGWCVEHKECQTLPTNTNSSYQYKIFQSIQTLPINTNYSWQYKFLVLSAQ